jgi:heme exporter protein A
MVTDHSSSDYSLSVRELSCWRYESMLFSDLNFSISSGQLLQVDGENGSGKTTLLKILCGFIEADDGQVLWQGEEIRHIREAFQGELNYIGHNNGIKTGLTCVENLKISTAYASRLMSTDFEHVLQQYGLGGFEDTFAYSLSAGQRRRLSLTRLTIRDARLWILDEPFTSLDESGRDNMKVIFYDHLQSGGMILMTSHDVIQWQGVTPHIIRL